MYVITGATGNVGSVAADTLLAQHKKVRVVVRDAKKAESFKSKGAEVFVADLHDKAAMVRALSGAEGAFLLLPPNVIVDDFEANNRALAEVLTAAVKEAKVPHVVLLSSVGAQLPDGTGPIKTLHYAENLLRQTGAAVTAIRAAYFMENSGMALAGLANGTFPTFLPPDAPFPQVATQDIGTQVAASLVEGGKGFRAIELKGPKDYSVSDVASALGKIVGKPLQVQVGPMSAAEATFVSFGLKPKLAALYREMLEGFATGKVNYDGTGDTVRGKTPVETVLQKLVSAPRGGH